MDQRDNSISETISSSAESIAIDAERVARMTEALDRLVAINKELSEFTRNDLTVLRRMKNANASVRNTLVAVCLTLGVVPDWLEKPGGKGEWDYWGPSWAFILRHDLFRACISHTRSQTVTADYLMPHIRRFVLDPLLQPQFVTQASQVAGTLSRWAHASYVAWSGRAIVPDARKVKPLPRTSIPASVFHQRRTSSAIAASPMSKTEEKHGSRSHAGTAYFSKSPSAGPVAPHKPTLKTPPLTYHELDELNKSSKLPPAAFDVLDRSISESSSLQASIVRIIRRNSYSGGLDDASIASMKEIKNNFKRTRSATDLDLDVVPREPLPLADSTSKEQLDALEREIMAEHSASVSVTTTQSKSQDGRTTPRLSFPSQPRTPRTEVPSRPKTPRTEIPTRPKTPIMTTNNEPTTPRNNPRTPRTPTTPGSRTAARLAKKPVAEPEPEATTATTTNHVMPVHHVMPVQSSGLGMRSVGLKHSHKHSHDDSGSSSTDHPKHGSPEVKAFSVPVSVNSTMDSTQLGVAMSVNEAELSHSRPRSQVDFDLEPNEVPFARMGRRHTLTSSRHTSISASSSSTIGERDTTGQSLPANASNLSLFASWLTRVPQNHNRARLRRAHSADPSEPSSSLSLTDTEGGTVSDVGGTLSFKQRRSRSSKPTKGSSKIAFGRTTYQ